MKTKTQTPRATRHVPSTGAKHSIQIAWRRPSSDLKRRCRRLLRLLKKRSVPLSSRHRLSARAVSDSFGFIFSFALSVSLCVFCVFVGWIAESEDFFSRGAETREFFSREAARERGSLSRGSTQEKKSVAWQHAREGAFSFSKSEPPFCLFPFSFVVDDARTTTRVRSYFPPSARRVCILFRERD